MKEFIPLKLNEAIPTTCEKNGGVDKQKVFVTRYQASLQNQNCEGGVCMMVDGDKKATCVCKKLGDIQPTRDSLYELFKAYHSTTH